MPIRPSFQLSAFLRVDVDNFDEAKKAVDLDAKEFTKLGAEFVVKAAKRNVHVVTGTLRNSIKADRPSQVRDRTDAARSRDLGQPLPEPEKVRGDWVLVVGGTTFYALVEELLHPYTQPATQEAIARGAGLFRGRRARIQSI